jgi:hypothetical protein
MTSQNTCCTCILSWFEWQTLSVTCCFGFKNCRRYPLWLYAPLYKRIVHLLPFWLFEFDARTESMTFLKLLSNGKRYQSAIGCLVSNRWQPLSQYCYSGSHGEHNPGHVKIHLKPQTMPYVSVRSMQQPRPLCIALLPFLQGDVVIRFGIVNCIMLHF